MIAVQTFQDTGQYTPKNQPSAKTNQISNHSSCSKQEAERSPRAKTNHNIRPMSENRILIARFVERLNKTELFGQIHVERYLNKLNRYGCRPSTIRMNFKVFYQFISYLKSHHRTCIETTVRDDIGGFVEYGQDRGLAATTVAAQLRCLYAFLKYLAEHDVVRPDLLKNKFRIKLPETLPRAIDPEDIKKADLGNQTCSQQGHDIDAAAHRCPHR